MTELPNAELRLKTDDFTFSSVISHHDTARVRGDWSNSARSLESCPKSLAVTLWSFSPPRFCSPPARPKPRRRRSRSARSRCSASRSRPAAPPASSSASCAPAMKPISGSASAARSSRASSMSATACAKATSSRGLIRRISSCRSRARRPSLPPRPRTWRRRLPILQRYATLKERGFAAIAEFDRKKAANDEAEGRLARARRALDLARNQLAYAELKADADGVITATLRRARPGGRDRSAGGAARASTARRKRSSPCRRPGSAKRAQAKATVQLVVGPRPPLSRRGCASSRRRPMPATRTYAARFTILDADDTVAFGMTATVTLERAARSAGGQAAARRRSSIAAPGPRSMWSTKTARLRCSR